MGYIQSNQQTPFIGYPQNQLYNPQDLQYMQDTQKDFQNWGQWQPGMTNVSQWITDPMLTDPTNPNAQSFLNAEQQKLKDYYQRVGTPYEQSQRQAYWEQMGGQHYGGIIAPEDPWSPFPGFPGYNKKFEQPGSPWGDLNSMGISSAYGMPAWQQDFFSQPTGPTGLGHECDANRVVQSCKQRLNHDVRLWHSIKFPAGTECDGARPEPDSGLWRPPTTANPASADNPASSHNHAMVVSATAELMGQQLQQSMGT